ncbi:MAG: TolC family protein [Candidatus Omnitrophica bacterium]|nr:TolC family protein [Candidatus Omnitrophota bacterium]
MKHNFVVFIIFIFLLTPIFTSDISVSQAAEFKASLNSLIEEALNNNPRLKAAQYRLEAAKSRVALFRSIPDPTVEYEYDKITPAASMTDGGKVRPMKSLAVSQEVPFPTKIFMRKKSAQKESNVLEQEYKQVEQSVRKDVKEAYFRLFLNRQKTLFIKDSLSLMRQFAEVTNKKYAANKAGQQDVLRAQVEYSKLSNMVILYEQEAKIAENLLKAVLGRSDSVPLDIIDADPAEDLLLSEEDAVALAKKHRPELRAVRAILAKAEVESSLSKQELLPDVTLKYKREEKDGSYRDGEGSGMIGINVPIWFWGKQLPVIREARANLEAAKADYAQAENVTVSEVRSSYAKYSSARSLIAIYETGVLPQATSAVMTARRAYEAGQLSFLELLDAVRMLRDLQMEYFESVAEAQIALADLLQCCGIELADI